MTIENSLIRKQILNQRFVRSLARQYFTEIKQLFDRVTARMQREPNNERLQAIRNDLGVTLNRGFRDLEMRITDDLLEFAVDEAAFLGEVVNTNSSVLLRVPDAGAIQRFLELNELDLPTGQMTLRLGEALRTFSAAQTKAIQTIITDGILLGDTIVEMARKIDALAESRTRAQAEALTRTVTNYASAQARKAFVVENKNVFDNEEWSAVLDSRTTLICGGRDGRVFPVGQGPYPPAHWNCRSVRIPVLKKEFESVSQKSNRKDFDEWLRNQDAAFQDEYFSQFPNGKEKAALFRRGELEVQQFRDETGKEYNLEQLRALYPVAFDKANLKLNSGP